VAKEQTTTLCQVAMLKKNLLEASCHLPADNLDH
jgi:hypothetical protein